MDQKNAKYIVPAMAFLFGWIIVGYFFAGIALAAATVYLMNIAVFQNETNDGPQSVFNDSNAFIHVILLLSGAVIKADGRIYKKELHLVKTRLAHDFRPDLVDKYMEDLNKILKKKINIEMVCHSVRQKFDYASKIQLLHFLVGLSVTNGIIVDSEFDLLRKISRLIDVPERSFASVLAMFNYKRVSSYKQTNSDQKSPYTKSSSSQLDKAYHILEIDANVPDEEVKKAYRKLAKIHHPDRVVHLGPEFQKNAKVKFQKIADAYEFIKTQRGFK